MWHDCKVFYHVASLQAQTAGHGRQVSINNAQHDTLLTLIHMQHEVTASQANSYIFF